MNKEELLRQVKSLAEQKLINKDELLEAYREGAGVKGAYHLNLSKILYFIGGVIIVIGVVVLVWQNWDLLNNFSKILVTLGTSVAAYVVGVLLTQYKKFDLIGQAFFLISALLAPVGFFITFDLYGFNVDLASTHSLIVSIIFAAYLVSFFVFRKNIFIIFSLIFGIWLYFALAEFFFGKNPAWDYASFVEYRILLAGLALIFLGYYFAQVRERMFLSGSLYGLGIVGFLGAALALGGWSPDQNVFWELIFPGLVFGAILLSIYLKSKAFLVFGSLFLMGYIIKITAEYFSNSLGWPFALVLAGLVLMAIGYGAFYLNKKYLK